MQSAKLDETTELDSGNIEKLAQEVAELSNKHGLTTVDGCCGTDNRHIQCIYFSQTNLLFILNYLNRWSKEKQIKDHIIIKIKLAAQENLYHIICRHEQSPTMVFPSTAIKHRPEANY